MFQFLPHVSTNSLVSLVPFRNLDLATPKLRRRVDLRISVGSRPKSSRDPHRPRFDTKLEAKSPNQVFCLVIFKHSPIFYHLLLGGLMPKSYPSQTSSQPCSVSLAHGVLRTFETFELRRERDLHTMGSMGFGMYSWLMNGGGFPGLYGFVGL